MAVNQDSQYVGLHKIKCVCILRMSATLLEKAISGKIPIYFVLAHGKDYSPSTQTITSVPKNKLLILPIKIGQMLTYEAAEALAMRLGTREKLKQLLSNLPKGFTVLKQTEQFADTILKFHDENLWTGIYRLPEHKLSSGLNKNIHKSLNVNMRNVNEVYTPARKKISTFLNENPEEEAVYIVASCRGVKNVPSSMVFPTRTVEPNRTSAQKKKLAQTTSDVTRQSKKRPTSSSNTKPVKKLKYEKSKKRKRSPKDETRKKQKLSTPSPVRDITRKLGAIII